MAQGKVNRTPANLRFNVHRPLAAIVEILIAQHFANDSLFEIAVQGNFLLRLYRTVADGFAPLADDFQLGRIGRSSAGNMAFDCLGVEQLHAAAPSFRADIAAPAIARLAAMVRFCPPFAASPSPLAPQTADRCWRLARPCHHLQQPGSIPPAGEQVRCRNW